MVNGTEHSSPLSERSVTERSLGLFTEVRAGEGATALLMFCNVFLILLAYYLIKPLREGWISISDIGGFSKVEVKAYSSFVQGLFLLFVVGWYVRFAGRLSRVTLITRATLLYIGSLLFFWLLQPNFIFEATPLVGIVFYVWVGISGVFVVAQFWTFCADVYNQERGKRILPLIAIGATSGGVVGSELVSRLVASNIVATESLLLLATLPLLLSIVLIRLVDSRESGSTQPVLAAKTVDGGSLLSGLRLVLVSRFLLVAAIATLLTNWVNTNGENLLFMVVQESLASQAEVQGVMEPEAVLEFTRDGTTVFYGNFFFWVNVIALILQAFVASRLLKYGGFAVIAMMLPVIALLSYTAMALLPILVIVKMMKVAENATDYSINNTARHVLWLPVSTEMKFRGKPAIDTFYVRVGDGLAAITVLLATHLFASSIESFLLFNIALVACWLVLTLLMVQEYRRASNAVSP